MRVLIIEDEARLARNVARILRTQAAYAVDVCANGTDGLHMALSNPYDLIVLDLMLPDIDGLDILRRLRAEGLDTPVLALTARMSTEEIVDGLNSGCDDYLTKPFKIAELVARCRALIRRSYNHAAPVLTAGEFQINTATRRIACRGKEHQLRGMEYRLLEYLVQGADHRAPLRLQRRTVLQRRRGLRVGPEEALRHLLHPDGARAGLRPDRRGAMSRLSLTWRISLQLSLVVCLTVGAACAIAHVQLRSVYLG